MAWIEVHQGIFHHRKTVTLAELLRIDRLKAGAHLISLWLWALDNAPDGNLTHISNRAIATGADYSGDRDRFCTALVEAGWVDQDGDRRDLHDWLDYAGRLLEMRLANRDKVRRFRQNKANVTVTTPLPLRYSNHDVTANPTVPNRTIPPTPLPLIATEKEISVAPAKIIWEVPDWWTPLTPLHGYAHRDHTKTATIISETCSEAGVDKANVVSQFAEYYQLKRLVHGWKDPVVALRNTLEIQIRKTRNGTGPPIAAVPQVANMLPHPGRKELF